jgi:hypothetical protein
VSLVNGIEGTAKQSNIHAPLVSSFHHAIGKSKPSENVFGLRQNLIASAQSATVPRDLRVSSSFTHVQTAFFTSVRSAHIQPPGVRTAPRIRNELL